MENRCSTHGTWLNKDGECGFCKKEGRVNKLEKEVDRLKGLLQKEIVNEEDYVREKNYTILDKKLVPDYPSIDDIDGVKTIRLGMISDTHLGSDHEKLKELNMFYEECSKRGIDTVLHAGDLVEGEKVFPGQVYSTKITGFDKQTDHFIKNFPKKKGIRTLFITGNHDYSFMRRIGASVTDKVESNRPDMKCIGDVEGRITIDGLKVLVLHTGGKECFALSHKSQKYLDNLSSLEQRPHVLLWGHHHSHLHLFYKGVHIFKPGCFLGRNDLSRRMNWYPQIGGLICEFKLLNDKVISVKEEFIQYPNTIEDMGMKYTIV